MCEANSHGYSPHKVSDKEHHFRKERGVRWHHSKRRDRADKNLLRDHASTRVILATDNDVPLRYTSPLKF